MVIHQLVKIPVSLGKHVISGLGESGFKGSKSPGAVSGKSEIPFFAGVMPLFFASLNSGSNGNCYYIGDSNDAVLIDAGVTFRETERRMERIGLSLDQVRAIFISHEHTDHTAGGQVISKRYGIPVYITENTYRNSRMNIGGGLVRTFQAHKPVQAGNLLVHPFPKQHDAADPFSFTVTGCGRTVGVFTDLGEACSHVKHHFSQCHAAFLESNYDEKMLEEGRYPMFLKNRIRSSHGHLSNDQALELFLSHRSPFMTHLLLSHLSQDNNRPELALELFRAHAGLVRVEIASRHGESPVYNLSDAEGSGPAEPYAGSAPPVQMRLF
jgi:phosphoribosyl 1,2-cyclic phosphodiesterase